MSKRLPQPGQPKRVRLVVEDDELARLDVMAAETRLSVASFVRALVVAAIDGWPELQGKVKVAAERLAAAKLPEGRRRPGRPKPPEPKKPKGK
jgi:hypothetical protein